MAKFKWQMTKQITNGNTQYSHKASFWYLSFVFCHCPLGVFCDSESLLFLGFFENL